MQPNGTKHQFFTGLRRILDNKNVIAIIFPEGLLIDVKKRIVLTKKVNSIFRLTSTIPRLSEGENENSHPNFEWLSPSVEQATEKSNRFCDSLCLTVTKNSKTSDLFYQLENDLKEIRIFCDSGGT